MGNLGPGNCRRLEEAHERCMAWSRRHGTKFAPDKYKLIHFTWRKRDPRGDLASAVKIEGFTEEIKPEMKLRVLGVWVDPKMKLDGAHKDCGRQRDCSLRGPLTYCCVHLGAVHEKNKTPLRGNREAGDGLRRTVLVHGSRWQAGEVKFIMEVVETKTKLYEPSASPPPTRQREADTALACDFCMRLRWGSKKNSRT